jgi:hypothetical protein
VRRVASKYSPSGASPPLTACGNSAALA